MKFSFKKLPPLGQDDYTIDCGCSGPCDCDGNVVCYPPGSTVNVTPGGSVNPSDFEIDYEDTGYCGENCGGFLFSEIPDFGSPYLLSQIFDPETEVCPALGMYVGCSLPCITVTGSPPTPVTITPRAFYNSPTLDDVARYYQRFSGLYPIEAYSSLPPGESELRVAKVDVGIDTVRRRDRVMILSGYNRYRYIGPLAVNCLPSQSWKTVGMASGYNFDEYVGLSAGINDPILPSWAGDLSDFNPDGCNPPLAPENFVRSVPLYGIIRLEELVHGEYPHPDWKARLPILGGTSAENPKLPPKVCCPSGTPCFTYDCIKCVQPLNDEVAQEGVPGEGYFEYPFRNPSGTNFNPDSHLGPISEPTGRRIQAPHCSLYSLFWAIRNFAFAYADSNLTSWFLYNRLNSDIRNWNGNCTQSPDNANGAPGSDGDTWWYSIDPLGYTEGMMNPFYVMQRIQVALPGFGSSGWSGEGFPQYQNTLLKWRIPRVLLWDPDGYNSAESTKDKWKHIYIPGSLNVVFDSGCVSTLGNAGGICRRNRGMILDSTSHRDNANGAADSARLLIFPDCGTCEGVQTPGGMADTPEFLSISMRYQACNFNHCVQGEKEYWFAGFTGEDSWCFNNAIRMDYTESDDTNCGRPECG